jgi:hypothetical protein
MSLRLTNTFFRVGMASVFGIGLLIVPRRKMCGPKIRAGTSIHGRIVARTHR